MGHWDFFKGTLKLVSRGRPSYYYWISSLLFLIVMGAIAYSYQWGEGLIVTGMRDEINWGLYIGNFSFVIGLTDAAVLLIIPAFIYHFKPIREIAMMGILLAISASITALLFVILDLGHPERALHLIPGIGKLNWPSSMLAWDALSVNVYLVLCLGIVMYVLYKMYRSGEPNWRIAVPLILLTIPLAVFVHMVTAFLYNGLAARPFWNASILAPRFLASAFCSGLSVAIIIFQIVRKVTIVEIEDEALFKLAEIVSVAMFLNLFLLAAEFYKEFYSDTIHLAPMKYLYLGLHGHNDLVPWMWLATALNVAAFFIFLIPRTRRNFTTLNLGAGFIFIGVWIEKGIGLIVPGFFPGVLGEMYFQYRPTLVEVMVTVGIWAVGALIYTLLLKVSIPIETGQFRYHPQPAEAPTPDA